MRHYYNKNRKNLLIICPILNLQGCKVVEPLAKILSSDDGFPINFLRAEKELDIIYIIL